MGIVAVLGLGASVELYAGGADVTIGVNDIWRKVQTDAIVCLDYPKVFNGDRLAVIENSKPQAFYSQIVRWDTRPDFRYLKLLPGYPDRHLDLAAPGFYKSYCSPFVAVQVAYKIYDATIIDIYGVDMVNHPNLKNEILRKIKIHFKRLFDALTAAGCQVHVYGSGILTQLF